MDNHHNPEPKHSSNSSAAAVNAVETSATGSATTATSAITMSTVHQLKYTMDAANAAKVQQQKREEAEAEAEGKTCWTRCNNSSGLGIVVGGKFNSGDTYLLGIAKNNYHNQDNKPHRLALDLGDTVIIVRETTDWYYGYVKNKKSELGVFPKSYVQLVEAELYQGEICLRRCDFIKEINTVLADWREHFNKLYLASDVNFQQLHNKMLELIKLRSQILTGNLPVDELREIKLQATSCIDTGNNLLGLDMIVRDEAGNVLDIGRTSTTHLYEQHVNAETRIRKANSNNKNRHSQTPNKYTQNLLLNVKAFVYKIHEESDTLFTLYDGETMKAITENFCVKWGCLGMPLNAEQCQVLFTDLSSVDLSSRRIYLICQVVRWGGMDAKEADSRRTSSMARKQSANSISAALLAASQSSGLAAAAAAADGGPGQMRRPFGVGFVDLTPVLKNSDGVRVAPELHMPFVPCEKESFDSTLRKLIATSDKSRIDSKLVVSVDLTNGETKQIKAMHPNLVLARKMGFPEVILPGEVRNDLYLTLVAGEFARGSKTSDKNIEVTVTVCNDQGVVVPGVLSLGAGAPTVDEYRSVIYYHDDRPKWNETFRIQVNIEEFKVCHLRFTFKHRSSNKDKDKNEKPFGFAFVRLMQKDGTALQHQQHQLVVYKLDQKKLKEDGCGLGTQYIDLPSFVADLLDKPKPSAVGLQLAAKDSFTIETNMCSTKLTQDKNLLELLNWSEKRETIDKSLEALMHVSPEEVVKFLQDILDALFDILRESDNLSSFVTVVDNLVFECLLRLIEIVDDKKYQHFQSVLDLYINESFSATLAYGKLISVLQTRIRDHLATPNDGELYRPVRNLQYIVKFIIRSRILHANLEANRDHKEFEATLKGLLDTFVQLTSSEKEMLRSQGTIVKFLHVITTDLMQVYCPMKLCEFIVEVIQKIPSSRLVQSKRQCIKDLVNSKLFHLGECRAILLPVFCQQIRDKLNNNEEGDTDIRQQEKNLSKVAKILGETTTLLHSRETTTKTKIVDCLNIMNNMLDLLFKGATNDPHFGSTDDDITTIMNILLRTVIQMASTMNTGNPLIRNMVAVMLGILRSMKLQHYQMYVRQFPRTELQSFLIEILSAFYNLVSNPVFPNEWMDMIMHQNTVILESLRQFTYVIMDKFFAPFEKPVWTTFFHCSIAFLTQPSLQLDRFASSKRTVILQRYEDIRRSTAEEIRHMWEKLGEHKPAFVPELVGPILEMSLIPETELRKATVPIFFDMMQCEWFSSRLVAGSYGDTKRCTAHSKGTFEDFEREMIRQLDMLVERGHGDADYLELFRGTMTELCRQHTVLCDPGLHFVETFSGLLGRLLEYRDIMQDESKENRMACTFSLLEYYKAYVNRSEMCIRYVDKLCALHEEFENYAEAAFTLRMHSSQLSWTDQPLSPLLRARRWPECQTHRQLKEQLSRKMVELFDRGQMWECAIDVCKELHRQFEHETYDYRQLAETLVKLAEFYRKIMDEKRYECEYFRVAFYGLRFAEFLRNKTFVYRGKQFERLSEFCTRLLTQHPAAELLQSMGAPGEETTQGDGQFILVNSVEPISSAEFVTRFEEHNTQIAWYYRTNDVRRFRFSRPYRVANETTGTDEGIGSLWLERTEMETYTALPGILRWSQVKETHTTDISPLQHACETMQVTNKIIRDLVIAHINDKELPINPLSMKITGVVDAAVMGGLAKYEEAFLTADYLDTHPGDIVRVDRLKTLIAEQIPLLEVALRVHRAKASPELTRLQERLETCFAQMQASVEINYGKRQTDLRFEPENFVTMRRPGVLPPIGLAETNRHSETSMGSSDSSGLAKSSYGNRSHPSIKSTFNFNFNSPNLTRTSLNSTVSKNKIKEKTPSKRRSSKKIERDAQCMSIANSQWYTSGTGTGTSTPPTPTLDSGSAAAAAAAAASGETHSMDAVSTTSTITSPVVELTEELTPQRPLRSEVERERRLSRPTSTITPTSSVQGMMMHAGDTHSLSGESSNRNSIVTTDSTASEEDAVPPPLPAKMRESNDYSSYTDHSGGFSSPLLLHHHQHNHSSNNNSQHYQPYAQSTPTSPMRGAVNRSLSMSVGSGRYTNKPLPAVPQPTPPLANNCNSSEQSSSCSSSTTITSITSHNASYDLVETSTDEAPRMRRAPPTPPPKPMRNSQAGGQKTTSPSSVAS